MGLLSGCGEPPDPGDTGEAAQASTLDLNFDWQPFTTDAVWNLKLSPSRDEVPLPAAGLATGDALPSDGPWGVKVYFAKSTDPSWTIQCGGYDTVLDTWPNPNPIVVQGPAGMVPPTGSDGTIVLVDKDRHYAYEIWQFQPQGGQRASGSWVEMIDLHSNGIHRTVGISGAGLPGIGGLLKSYETKNDIVIRHKMWVAANRALLYSKTVWPATATDIHRNGAHAALDYGDVIALSKGFDVNHNECNLSPFIKRIATALKDYGGIIQDNSGDALDFVAEVDSIKDYIDVDYDSTFYVQFACLKKHLVKVVNPWVGATPGGLGFKARN